MSAPYIGEIRIFAGTFAPQGWAFCDGQLLPISENDTLFVLIGTTFGGDGQETFGLPDLRGRIPVHMNPNAGFTLGQMAGVEDVTLTAQQIPAHSHGLLATTANPSASPSGALPATATSTVTNLRTYGPTTNMVGIHPASIGVAGGSQPHTNLQPYLAVNFIISLFGIFPQQN
jgi:microcystin-dependent protein